MPDEKNMPLIGRSVYTLANRHIHSGPCIVNCVHVAGDGANADCQVYDGESTSGRLVAHLETLSGTSYSWCPPGGADFDFGIYIAVNAATTKVTVTYIPESRKKFI
jgi:hypothetical protein